LAGGGTGRSVSLLHTYRHSQADNGIQILPWDSDIDVQVAEESMHFLASYYNMTIFHYRTPRIPEGRDYMLEINPYYKVRDQSDTMNVIDARWVDTDSGLFIDITTVRKNYTHPAGPGILSCKDGHEYRVCFLAIFGECYH
jgi:LicD family